MLRTVTADTAGNNLSSFRNVSAELCCVLVIDMLYLIHTEHADLFLRSSCSLRSFTSFSHLCFLLIKFYAGLERQIVLAAVKVGKSVHVKVVAEIRRARRVILRRTLIVAALVAAVAAARCTRFGF